MLGAVAALEGVGHCFVKRTAETVMEKCEAAVAETGMRLVPGLIKGMEGPETEREGKAVEVKDANEA